MSGDPLTPTGLDRLLSEGEFWSISLTFYKLLTESLTFLMSTTVRTLWVVPSERFFPSQGSNYCPSIESSDPFFGSTHLRQSVLPIIPKRQRWLLSRSLSREFDVVRLNLFEILCQTRRPYVTGSEFPSVPVVEVSPRNCRTPDLHIWTTPYVSGKRLYCKPWRLVLPRNLPSPVPRVSLFWRKIVRNPIFFLFRERRTPLISLLFDLLAVLTKVEFLNDL